MDAIDSLLTRGVDAIYPSRKELEKVLRSGKKLRLYQGFDPTGTQLHIGHAVGFRKLRQWQNLGHEVIFLIGDGTGQAGDPSGKKKSRDKFSTTEELRNNGRDYVMQASKIVNFEGPNPVKILYNGDWLNKLNLTKLLEIAGHFTLQQMIERDLYQERLSSGMDLSLREFLYPLLQGYDSVAMEVDLELGGSDQTFNMLAGRKLVRSYLNKDKFVMTTPLLTDSKGVKIGKTEGNVIGITDPPIDFYGKIMSLGDDAILPCFTLLTDMSLTDIEVIKEKISGGKNPMEFKKQLAFALTEQFNNATDAAKAQKNFESVVQKGELDQSTLLTNQLASLLPNASLTSVLVTGQFATSKSEARRLIEQKAVEINGRVLTDPNCQPKLKSGDIIKVGKKLIRKFV